MLNIFVILTTMYMYAFFVSLSVCNCGVCHISHIVQYVISVTLCSMSYQSHSIFIVFVIFLYSFYKSHLFVLTNMWVQVSCSIIFPNGMYIYICKPNYLSAYDPTCEVLNFILHSQYCQKSLWMDDAVGDTELCVNLTAMLFGAKYCRMLPL
jgi:hypothetical protein